jgi:hypothetical protein
LLRRGQQKTPPVHIVRCEPVGVSGGVGIWAAAAPPIKAGEQAVQSGRAGCSSRQPRPPRALHGSDDMDARREEWFRSSVTSYSFRLARKRRPGPGGRGPCDLTAFDRRETIWLAVGTPAAASKRAPLPAQFSIAGGSIYSGQTVHNRRSRNRITGCNPERELPVSRRHFDRYIRTQCASDAQRALLAALMALPGAAAIGANGT